MDDFSKALIKKFGGSYLDENNILFKFKEGKFIGKRCVQTYGNRHLWLEEIGDLEVKCYLSGQEADYEEIFTND